MLDEDRVFDELVGVRNEIREGREEFGELKGMVLQFMSNHEQRAAKISERVGAVEKGVGQVRAWAIAAAVLVPGTLGVVAWFLSKIPAAAWSSLGQ